MALEAYQMNFVPTDRAIIRTRIATATAITITIMIFFYKVNTHINTNCNNTCDELPTVSSVAHWHSAR